MGGYYTWILGGYQGHHDRVVLWILHRFHYLELRFGIRVSVTRGFMAVLRWSNWVNVRVVLHQGITLGYSGAY